MNLLFSNLVIKYPIINKILFKIILEHILAPINIIKLLINYTLDCKEIKILNMGNALAINVLEEGTLVLKFKKLSYLFQCFFYIILYFYI